MGKRKQKQKDSPVVVRSDRAGVFVGNLVSKKSNAQYAEVKLTNARRLWCWSGAASLSQIANDGVADPDNCKFPESVSELEIFGVIEILPMTDKAVKSINAVPVWKR